MVKRLPTTRRLQLIIALTSMLGAQGLATSLAVRRREMLQGGAGLGWAAALAAASGSPQIAAAACHDDECIFSRAPRAFDRAGRRYVIAQEFGTASSTSTGTGVWECAEVLSVYLAAPEVATSLVSRQPSVLELGAGCGLCSMVVSAGGAARVVATDGDGGVLSLLGKVFDENQSVLGVRPEVARLRWEEATAATARTLGSPFGLVLGADVTYYPGSAVALANALLAFSGAQSTILLAHKRRRPVDDTTLATLATYFSISTLQPPDRPGGVFILGLARRPTAPPDLGLGLADEQNCNQGYLRKSGACVLAPPGID